MDFCLLLKTRVINIDAIKAVSKRAIQKTAEETGDLIGNKNTDKITSVSKNFPKELRSQNEDKIEILKER